MPKVRTNVNASEQQCVGKVLCVVQEHLLPNTHQLFCVCSGEVIGIDVQLHQRANIRCQVPCDHIPVRSWPFFRARALLQAVIASFKAEQHP